MDRTDKQSTGANRNARAVGITLGTLFALVGLATILLLVVTLFRDAESISLFYRVFGIIVAVAFVAVGGGLIYGAVSSSSDAGDAGGP